MLTITWRSGEKEKNSNLEKKNFLFSGKKMPEFFFRVKSKQIFLIESRENSVFFILNFRVCVIFILERCEIVFNSLSDSDFWQYWCDSIMFYKFLFEQTGEIRSWCRSSTVCTHKHIMWSREKQFRGKPDPCIFFRRFVILIYSYKNSAE